MSVRRSLPDRVYLVAYDAGRRKLTGARLHHLVRAAALEELLLRGLVRDADGKVVGTGRATTGDPVLDGVLAMVRDSERPRPWKHWVGTQSARTRDALRDRLAAERVVRVERRKALRLFPYTAVTLRDARPAKALQAVAARALTGATPTTHLDRRDIALTAIAAIGELDTVATARVRRDQVARIAELTALSGPAVPALKKLIEEEKSASSSG